MCRISLLTVAAFFKNSPEKSVGSKGGGCERGFYLGQRAQYVGRYTRAEKEKVRNEEGAKGGKEGARREGGKRARRTSSPYIKRYVPRNSITIRRYSLAAAHRHPDEMRYCG